MPTRTKQSFTRTLIMLITTLTLATPAVADQTERQRTPSFAQLDQRAREGGPLNVVFFGGSLTWGANATDPQRTSYRAVVTEYLRNRYPKAQVIPHDAAIGGTGSQLGIFRLDRDVLRHKPDLLILDFTANDNIRNIRGESLATYETIVRRTIAEANCPVVLVILPFKGDITADETALVRRAAHIELANAYQCAVADAVSLMRTLHADGKLVLDEIWDTPTDSSHPGDAGYRLFAQAVRDGFEKAIADNLIARVPPTPLHGEQFATTLRHRLATGSALPAGWSAANPNRVGAYFDMQPSRWLDTLALARGPQAQPLTVRFRGTSVSLFGESTATSGRYRITLDGQLIQKGKSDHFDAAALANRLKGNVRMFESIATGLDPHSVHTLTIEPLLDENQELRIESLCIAGLAAAIVTETSSD